MSDRPNGSTSRFCIHKMSADSRLQGGNHPLCRLHYMFKEIYLVLCRIADNRHSRDFEYIVAKQAGETDVHEIAVLKLSVQERRSRQVGDPDTARDL